MNRYAIDAYNPNDVMSYNYVNRDYDILHDHDYWEFFVIINGSCTHTINGFSYTMHQSDCCLIRPSDKHKIKKTNPKFSDLNIMFREDDFRKICDNYSPDLLKKIKSERYCAYKLPFSVANEFMGYVLYTGNKDGDPNKKLSQAMIFTTIINEYIKSKDFLKISYPIWLYDLIEKIDLPQNGKWNVENVVRESGFSHTHLNRLLNKYMHCSIVELLTDNKMDRAGQMLLKTDKKIKDIALELGYENISNFNRFFKRKYSVSPLKYRQNQK